MKLNPSACVKGVHVEFNPPVGKLVLNLIKHLTAGLGEFRNLIFISTLHHVGESCNLQFEVIGPKTA